MPFVTTRRTPLLRLVLLCVSSLSLLSCRETHPVYEETRPPARLRFLPGDSFIYDNWKILYGGRDVNSRYTNTWTVTDTGLVLRSRSNVTVIIDSTFGAQERFVRRDTILLSVDDNGDVFQYGFLNGLIAERETLIIARQWERIAAFSQTQGTSWVMARLDTSVGVPQPETVIGVIGTTQPYVGITVNGLVRGVFAYEVDITKPELRYTLLIVDAPAAIVQTYDEAGVYTYDILRQLRSMKTR